MDATTTPRRRLRLLVPRLFDSLTGEVLRDQAITISRISGLIVDVRSFAGIADPGAILSDGAEVVDMRLHNLTILPGFIDTHVHLFLYPYAQRSWSDQVTRESTAERTIRATVHARDTLMAGFTTVRDLGTEGAEDADLALRKALSGPNPIIMGPRYFTANRAIVSTGSYGPKCDLHPNEEGVDGKHGAVAVDGVENCVREVRRQIGAGADWIKIYADYRARSRQADANPNAASKSWELFSVPELRAMIDTAHSVGVKVAAHATTAAAVNTLSTVGIDSIEHGVDMTTASLKAIQGTNIFWNPTLGAYKAFAPPRYQEASRRVFQEALKMGGIRIACGGDTGVFAHGANALELLLMIEYGADWREVLKWATIGGWECIRGMDWEGRVGESRLKGFEAAVAAEDEQTAFEEIGEAWPLGDNDIPLGAIRPGFAADLIGLDVDLLTGGGPALVASLGGYGISTPQKAGFVMKAGRIYRMDGAESVVPSW